jgi:hypothetical protein
LERSKIVYTSLTNRLSENGNERRRWKKDLILIKLTSDANEHEYQLVLLV